MSSWVLTEKIGDPVVEEISVQRLIGIYAKRSLLTTKSITNFLFLTLYHVQIIKRRDVNIQ